ncbi:DUF2516 family protein [Nocardioides mangrovi]|uniref:DUF2516 family protein n=1 Tax=Nocardioides mangrovi TaxID=2874580 RepID=A0ABS7UCT7_9ACTN|nr:DUF2516 family protein [Nocardioides mangrovi]MBZ5738516.1 DUF2516 family protein [Nocardioides mangrovi]
MSNVFALEWGLMSLLALLMLAVKVFAFISSLTYSNEAYDAANKLNKPAWTIILGIGVAAQLVLGGLGGIISLAFTIAALVYLADVRPALRSLTRRR